MGLGEVVERVTKSRIGRQHFCHQDPMFEGGRCAFGQTGAAQAHLTNKGVAPGDIFLFFGLFSDSDGRRRHHRVFGYLLVREIRCIGPEPSPSDQPQGFLRRHPHTIGQWNANNTLYLGEGVLARTAAPELCLSAEPGQVSEWRVPIWLRSAGLTYHGDAARWSDNGKLTVVGRGQEFVADVSTIPEASAWLGGMITAIEARGR